ncbi:MAG TPA: hypothetical protein DEP72_00290 [Clostridiales bacterium]|nr:MAG: hypothetical protein A2Y18_00875 [Clostridiales bacterium GWD2_32_19]HCC06590.1 hypothetical protein [Clostridiales bacterium]
MNFDTIMNMIIKPIVSLIPIIVMLLIITIIINFTSKKGLKIDSNINAKIVLLITVLSTIFAPLSIAIYCTYKICKNGDCSKQSLLIYGIIGIFLERVLAFFVPLHDNDSNRLAIIILISVGLAVYEIVLSVLIYVIAKYKKIITHQIVILELAYIIVTIDAILVPLRGDYILYLIMPLILSLLSAIGYLSIYKKYTEMSNMNPYI